MWEIVLLSGSASARNLVTPPTPNGYAALFYPPLEARGSLLVKAGAAVWVSASGNHWAEVALPTSNASDPDLASALHILSDRAILVGTVGGAMYRIARGAADWSSASVTPLAAPGNGYVSDIATSGSIGRTIWVSC